MNERQKFLTALIAPIGITLMGLVIQSEPIIIGGIVFTALIVFARFLRSRM